MNDLIKKHVTKSSKNSYCEFLIRAKQLQKRMKQEYQRNLGFAKSAKKSSKKLKSTIFSDAIQEEGSSESESDEDLNSNSKYDEFKSLFPVNDPIGGTGIATVFIAHSWGAFFLETVEAIKHYVQGDPNVYIWFDVCSINQHADRGAIENKEWFQHTFRRAIQKIGHVVLVFNPWQVIFFALKLIF